MPELQQEPILAIQDLEITFRTGDQDVAAVKGLSFDLYKGEILALVGESGSGKSATALSVLGLLPDSATVDGSVIFEGNELVGLAPDRLRAIRGGGISIVFQDPAAALDPVFTIGSQLSEAIIAHNPRLPAADIRRRAIELLTLVEIPDPAGRLSSFPHQLSGGQLQRVMIAIALANNPRVLIADEPTTALDVTIQQEILDLLRRFNRDFAMSILLITHDMGVVADLAQRVMVLRHGRLVESAAVQALFDNPAHPYTRSLLAAVPKAMAADRKLPRDVVPLLQVENLRINYATTFSRTADIVKDVSFEIGVGEIVGLVGESGSGKTSIGRSLLGLAPLTGGRVLIEGRDIARTTTKQANVIRSRIGMVFQSPSGSLNPRLTVGQSIAEPLRTGGHLRSKDIQRSVEELLERVRLPAGWRNRYPHELSGGQKQRVAIARAIALHPTLLIADEPTSALDVSIQAEILDLLRELQKEALFACLFISHDLLVVQSLCNRVVVLRSGEIVEQGETADILGNPSHPYSRKLVLSAPVADPGIQAERRRSFVRHL